MQELKNVLSSHVGDSMSVRSTKEEEHLRGVPIPNEIYNLKLVLVAVTAASAAVIIGYDSGFIGTTVSLSSFQLEFGFDKMSASAQSTVEANVVSVFQAGAYFGCLLFYPIGEILGRKMGLIISGFFLTFGAAISLIANGDRGLGAIYASRVLTGFGIGGCSGLATIYVSEISPPSVRGKLIGCWEISWQVGGIVGYWINYGVSKHVASGRKQWLIPFAIQLIPSAIFWLLCFWVPESPRFLLAKGKIDKARASLSSLRNLPEDHPYSVHEIEIMSRSIEENIAETGRGFLGPLKALFFTKKLAYRLLLSVSLFMMQNGFGINAVTYYSPTIFKSLGVSGSNSTLLSTGIFGVLKGFAAVIWVFVLVDRFGRRVCLCFVSLPCTFCMWYIGAYVKVADPSSRLASGDTSSTPGGTAAKAMLYIWTVFYGATWNGTPWVIGAELFPQSVRAVAQAINASSNWFWAFIMGHFTGQALGSIGFGFYFIFAACSAVFPVIVYLLYPETKSVPLEAMDYLFEVPAWKAHAYALQKYEAEILGLRRKQDELESVLVESDDQKENI